LAGDVEIDCAGRAQEPMRMAGVDDAARDPFRKKSSKLGAAK